MRDSLLVTAKGMPAARSPSIPALDLLTTVTVKAESLNRAFRNSLTTSSGAGIDRSWMSRWATGAKPRVTIDVHSAR
jgi:hypothetical protein